MIPIKKLNIAITQEYVEASESLTKWQQAINFKCEDGIKESLVEQSKKADAKPTLWNAVPAEKSFLIDQLFREQKGLCCYCGQKLELNAEKGIIIEHLNPRRFFPTMMFNYKNLFASCSGGQPLVRRINPKIAFTREQISESENIDIKKITVKASVNTNGNTYPAGATVEIRLGTAEDLHCDAKKGDAKITIQPIVEDSHWIENSEDDPEKYQAFSCQNKITYTRDGVIKIDDNEDHITLTTLNLNLDKLKKGREEVFKLVEKEFYEIAEESQFFGTQDIEEIKDIIQLRIKQLILEIEEMLQQESFAFVKTYFLRQKIVEVS